MHRAVGGQHDQPKETILVGRTRQPHQRPASGCRKNHPPDLQTVKGHSRRFRIRGCATKSKVMAAARSAVAKGGAPVCSAAARMRPKKTKISKAPRKSCLFRHQFGRSPTCLANKNSAVNARGV